MSTAPNHVPLAPHSEVKRMDLLEFIDRGFLQEANRLFFHPRGLALEVTLEPGKPPRISGVWDYRSDPEGLLFQIGTIDPAKVESVETERLAHLGTRLKTGECDPTGVQF